ncbi:MAG: hypothetical protein Q4A31_02710 [Corynebacterium sp.]|uniref:hypothetical protein n=1 Tax=Corynebacterium sp. TaxID=1720 RepID=UPI0026DD6D0A|nr:hypothetical protein [Corynebacterium sp.]MDO4760817.1 hypothetical protein [Corynebacterium sp.]
MDYPIITGTLPPQLDHADACARAVAALHPVSPGLTKNAIEEVQLSHFPLLGVEFEVVAHKGPALKVTGSRFPVVVDRVSGVPVITSVWPQLRPGVPEGSIDCESLRFRIDIDEGIEVARHAVTVSVMRRLKLASVFDLQLRRCVWPLWKPNYVVRFPGCDVLVDAVTGNVAVRENS